MRRTLWLIIALLLAVGALVSTPQVRGAGENIPPQVVDTNPARGEELPLDGVVTFYFDQAMDRASVESAIKISPAIKGTVEWQNDSTAVFHPSQPLQRATEYTFTLDSSARSKSGAPLRDTFALKLRTVGVLEVAQVLPASGSKDVEATPTITVIFNRPVVPLLPVEEMGKLPSPITISPAADGKGEWLNTSIYTFKPTTPLKGGTTYTVTVKKGLTDITGSALQNDVTFSFSTVSPRVIEFQPADNGGRILRDPQITVTFSQPMDKAAAESAFSLIGPTGASIPGDFKWNDETYTLTFTPGRLLDYGVLYMIRIDRTKARSAAGAMLSADAQSMFQVIPQPDIISTRPENGKETDPYGGFQVNFSAPMKLGDFKSRVTVQPKPGLTFEDNADEDGFSYAVNFSTEPSTSYTITIDVNGLLDKYGTPIKPDPKSTVYQIVGPGKVQIKYTTSAYPPEASLKTGSDTGLYSAYRPQTRVYSTHRNISTINLGLWSIPVMDFLRLSASNDYDYQNRYSPKNLLRRWTVPVDNPQNVLRYDLLTISDQGPSGSQAGNVACIGAPPSRLKVGDKVVVLKDDPTPLRVRAAAGMKGAIVAQVKPGAEFMIVGGPICADNYVWWAVQSTDGTTSGWAAEGDLQHYFIGLSNPVPTATAQSGGSAQTALKPGAYWLEFDTPQIPDKSRKIRHLMLVATTNITLKVSPEREALAWVTDLQSGQPVAGVNVTFYTGPSGAIPIANAVKTDENGLARIPLAHVPTFSGQYDLFAVADDGKNFGVGTTNWADGITAWDFNQEPNYYVQDVTVYLYTDRSLYRPGQPVYYRGVLRSRDDVTYGLSDLKTVPVAVVDDKGQTIYEKDVQVDAFGAFSDSFTIDPNASLGYYNITARPGFQKPQKGEKTPYNGPEFSRGFSVAQYRTPEFQVKATAEKSAVVQGDKVSVTVDSSFFFGGAVSNARVEWYARTTNYYFNYKGSGSYSFYDFNEDEGYREYGQPETNLIANGVGRTDAQGRFVVEVPADLGKAKQSQVLSIEAQVTDESDQMVAGTADVIVHQGEFYIGAAPQEYVGTANKPLKFDLIAVDWDSKPKPNTDLSVRAVERVWSSVQSVDPDTGRTVWNYDVKENPVADGVVHTDADGKAVYEFTPPRGGVYKVYATSRDSRGNQITTSAFVWVAGPDYVPWRQQNSNRIDLKIDRDSYKVGDTASILIASPFQGEVKALVTVERGGVLKSEVLTLPNNSTVYKLPITADMAPNAFVSVVLVKGVDARNPVAAFRMGMIQFDVETDRLELKMTITPDKPQAGPREKVNYKIHVTDYQGKPVQAEVGVGLTDLAVLSLMPDTSTPILRHFYGKQGLAVRTASTLTISVDQQTQQIINTVKGGGGGGPEGGIFEVRQQFVDTPLWQPAATTDENGDAVVSVTLPDQLTTWRLDARAITKPTGELATTLVGQTTFDLLSTKPLLIRPVTPRFYVVGDTSTLAAIVNNNTEQAQDVKVRVEVNGATLKGSAEQTGTIPSRGRARFEWPVEVQDVNAVSVTFFANTPDNKYTDAAKSAVGQGDDKTLPVLRYEAPETVGTGGMIGKEGGDSVEGIVLPRRFNVTQGTLEIRAEPSLAASATAALDVLKNYPYQCIEQTISKFLPNLMTYRALKQLGLDDPKMQADLSQAINYAVQRLYAEQHVDGGWGWFVQDDSNPLVTAYALLGLSEARAQGFDVDQNVTGKAVQFLQKNLTNLGDQASAWQLNRQSFLLYALARAGSANVSATGRLFQIRERMSIYARAYLAMTFKIIGQDSQRYTDPLISDLQNRAVASATGMHWQEDYTDVINWNTDTRTTAIVLKALVELQPTNPLIPNVVRWLMIARQADAWETTQETAWAVMALTDWMQVTGELKANYTFNVSVNDKSIASNQQASPDTIRQSVNLQIPVKDLLTGEVNKLTVNRTSGDGTLYYTAHLTAYLPVEQVKPLTRGLSITRSYSLITDKDRKPITQAHVGDNILVTLTIVAPNDLDYVVINDPIPAGAEAVNPELATSGSVGKAPELRLDDPLSRGWGWWWFSKTELRDDRTVLYATYLPKGTYQFTYTLRAGLAGQYHVMPATGQEFYFPDVYGRSDGMLFTLLPAAGGTDPTNPATPEATATK